MMPDSINDIVDILKKYIRQLELTPQETEKLNAWLRSSRENELLMDNILDPQLLAGDLRNYKKALENKEINREKLQAAILREPSKLVSMPAKWIRYAAIILLTLGLGTTIFILSNKNAPVPANDTRGLNNGASSGIILTLSDGSEILLDSVKNGMVTSEQGTKISLIKGQLVYDSLDHSVTQLSYNKLTTPKGRQLTVTLPDGSRVWLNAMSSLRYPVTFQENERKVEVSGEAFFEVAKNASKPFVIDLRDKISVEVLGTSFNINAYTNESSINTTLIEGIVKVNDSIHSRIVKPGEQCQVGKTGEGPIIKNVNVEQVTAWKTGIFDFDNMKLGEVMRQVERWYDVQVIYQDGIPELEFGGKISRNLPLRELIHFLEGAGVRVQLDGKKLNVLR